MARFTDATKRFLKDKEHAYQALAYLLYALIALYTALVMWDNISNPKSAAGIWQCKLSYETWQSTGSLFHTLKAALLQSMNQYATWEGNFTALFLYQLSPGILSEKLYFLSNLLIILSFLGNIFALLSFLVNKAFLKADKWLKRCLNALVLLFLLYAAPNLQSHFAWYENGVFYTLMFSMSLFWLNLVLRLPAIKRGKPILRVLIPGLAFLVGGSNFNNSFLLLSIHLTMGVVSLRRKSPERLTLFISLLMLSFGILINLKAPGYAFQNAWMQEINHPQAPLIRALTETLDRNLYSFLRLPAPVWVFMAALSFLTLKLIKQEGHVPDSGIGLPIGLAVFALIQTLPGVLTGYTGIQEYSLVSFTINVFFLASLATSVIFLFLRQNGGIDKAADEPDIIPSHLMVKLKGSLPYLPLFLLILSLIPMFCAAFYSRPFSDDYFYGAPLYHSLKSGLGFFQALPSVFDHIKNSYYTWQGTFSAIFLFSIHPGVFSDKLYGLSSLLLVLVVILGTGSLFHVLLKHYLNLGRTLRTALISLFLIFAIQNNPWPGSSFYWYNGAMYYTFFQQYAFFLFSLLLLLPKIKEPQKKTALSILLPVLFFILGGGNFMTALFSSVVMALFCILWGFRKQKHFKAALISFIFLLCGFLISAIAPGNKIRAEEHLKIGYKGLPPFEAILQSLIEGMEFILTYMDMRLMILTLVFIFLLWKPLSRSDFSFPYPLLVLILSFLVFCALLTPLVYVNMLPTPKNLSIVYSSFLHLWILNAVYSSAWFLKRKRSFSASELPLSIAGNQKKKRIMSAFFGVLIIIAFFYGGTSHQSCLSLQNGEIQHYTALRDRQLAILKDPQVKDAILPPVPYAPPPFSDFFFDYQAKSESLINLNAAICFNKNSVVVR